ncbi:glycine N-acyltransferase-like protein 3 [Pelodiscus sinensis]|uniref:glycine N-acyltransferase-like protein 3 n=1 Tax=Pelodiscus sinensis TaxID=13735 RepID=UPI003F6C3229
MYAAFYRNLGAYQAFLGSTGAINGSRTFRICGLQDGVYETASDVIKDKGLQLEATKYFTYLHPNPSIMPEIRTLDPRKCLVLGRDFNTTLEKRDRSGLENLQAAAGIFKEIIDHHSLVDIWRNHHPDNTTAFTYIRVLLPKCQQPPISWSLLDPFGAMGHSNTLPQYRGRGYMQVISTMTAKQMHARGYPIYDLVEQENHPVQRLQESQGFQHQPSLCHCVIHTPGPATAPARAPWPSGSHHPT